MLDDAIDAELTAAEIAASQAELQAAHIDGSRMLLEHDPLTGTREILHFDDAADTFTIERVTDVEPVLEWCKGFYNAGIANAHCEFRPMASLPTVVLDIYGKERGLPDGWYHQKEYHHVVLDAAHDRDLSGFRLLPGEFRRRGRG